MTLVPTASQTAGPFVHIGLTWLCRDCVAPPGADGERVTVEGRVLDGDGQPVTDAIVEIWQADPHGRYAGTAFQGFGRVPTDGNGNFRFTTVKPGRVPGPDGTFQAPHLLIAVFARGLLKQVVTRMYFPDEPGNAADPVLALVPADRRLTLVARPRGAGVLAWDIVLQGRDETVFFDV
ncbi:MAG TPA: protocatechuate 3,4-dioxygenase subunit alpha [Gemmataceae bacterium]|nr:protocatechuate 3,4-dioxygenase subunit alpha [Gemmataceae bacterium]